MDKIKIGNKFIGQDKPVFIIAEIGSNYNQDFETAKKMIKVAKSAGVDAVKFQIFHENKLYPPNAGKVDYLKKDVFINELVRKAEVPDEMHKRLFDYCRDIGLIYLCTPTDRPAVDYLDSLRVAAFKIASYDLTNHYLLKYIAAKGKPIILSTGATEFTEVAEALDVVYKTGNKQIILLQCAAKYPADYKLTNLKVMQTYTEAFNVPVGISDHSADPCIVPFAAVALGAMVLEKHFTLDCRQDGPDHAFAIEPDELKRMVDGIRKVEQALGASVKEIAPEEEELRRFASRCIFSTRDIKAGEILNEENIDILRPGKKELGVEAKHYESILGKRAAQLIKANIALQWPDIKE